MASASTSVAENAPKANPKSIARTHAHVNDEMPREYWDYDNLNIQWGYLSFSF